MDAAVYGARSQLVEDEAGTAVLKMHPLRWRLKMINWPEMLRPAEDWANGFWTGAVTTFAIGTVAVAAALISHAI
jgi:hypothetical protein